MYTKGEEVEPVNDRQTDTLTYIKHCVLKRGYPPTMRELASHTNVSVSTARSDLETLENEGKIIIEWGKPRAIRIVEEK
jgi:repressor LexA